MAAQYCGEGIVSVVVTILPHLAQSVLTLTLRKKNGEYWIQRTAGPRLRN